MSTETRPRGTFGVAKKHIPGVQDRAQTMHDRLVVAASTFTSPPISMIAFLALITALATAQQVVTNTRAKGSASLRNTKRDALWTAMELLRAYVQGLADVLPAQNAAALIESAGLVVAATAMRNKEVLAAELTTTPGAVHLVANASILIAKDDASKKALFNWQWSGDGGKTWNDIHATPYASTDIESLTLMGTYSFRVSVTVGKVTGAWSQPVSLLVH